VSRSSPSPAAREHIAQAFTSVEDLLYVGLGVVLAAGGVALLVNAALYFGRNLLAGEIGSSVVAVQVSFREHVLVPEPFVLVALIAGVRRILVITAEFGTLPGQGESAFRYAMIELGLLTVMTGVLVTCLVGLRKRDKEAVAEPA
jgi:hypothetical protein